MSGKCKGDQTLSDANAKVGLCRPLPFASVGYRCCADAAVTAVQPKLPLHRLLSRLHASESIRCKYFAYFKDIRTGLCIHWSVCVWQWMHSRTLQVCASVYIYNEYFSSEYLYVPYQPARSLGYFWWSIPAAKARLL